MVWYNGLVNDSILELYSNVLQTCWKNEHHGFCEILYTHWTWWNSKNKIVQRKLEETMWNCSLYLRQLVYFIFLITYGPSPVFICPFAIFRLDFSSKPNFFVLSPYLSLAKPPSPFHSVLDPQFLEVSQRVKLLESWTLLFATDPHKPNPSPPPDPDKWTFNSFNYGFCAALRLLKCHYYHSGPSLASSTSTPSGLESWERKWDKDEVSD